MKDINVGDTVGFSHPFHGEGDEEFIVKEIMDIPDREFTKIRVEFICDLPLKPSFVYFAKDLKKIR